MSERDSRTETEAETESESETDIAEPVRNGTDERRASTAGTVTDEATTDEAATDETATDGTATDETATVADVEALRGDVVAFAEEVEDRIVKRDDLESDLEAYVRRRQRAGHARGWGPYLVLLYGTAMTVGAFFFLDDGWAVLAMLVVWLSTLGLYALMVLVGFVGTALGAPGRLLDRLREFRS